MEHILLFSFFAISAIFSAFLIIISKNPIQSIFFLILSFINVAVLLFLLGLEFLPMAFLVVYVGAISVLFLFIVMMLNLRIIKIKDNSSTYLVILFFIILVLFSVFLLNKLVLNDFFLVNSNYCNNFLGFKELSLFIDNLVKDGKSLTIIKNTLLDFQEKRYKYICESLEAEMDHYRKNSEEMYIYWSAVQRFYINYIKTTCLKSKEAMCFVDAQIDELYEHWYLHSISNKYIKLIMDQVNLDYYEGKYYGDQLLSPIQPHSDKLKHYINEAINNSPCQIHLNYSINKVYNSWLLTLLIEQINFNPELAKQSLLELLPNLSESKISLIVNNPEKYLSYFLTYKIQEEVTCDFFIPGDFFLSKIYLKISELEEKPVVDIDLVNHYKKLLVLCKDYINFYINSYKQYHAIKIKYMSFMNKCNYDSVNKLWLDGIFDSYYLNRNSSITTMVVDSPFVFKNFLKVKDSLGDIKVISQILYESKIIAFILSALILLVAMLGAIVLTLTIKKDKISVKRQEISNQVYRKIRFKIYENFKSI